MKRSGRTFAQPPRFGRATQGRPSFKEEERIQKQKERMERETDYEMKQKTIRVLDQDGQHSCV